MNKTRKRRWGLLAALLIVVIACATAFAATHSTPERAIRTNIAYSISRTYAQQATITPTSNYGYSSKNPETTTYYRLGNQESVEYDEQLWGTYEVKKIGPFYLANYLGAG